MMTDKARKVWIFKWLLKKNRCLGVHLEKDFFKTKTKKNGKKVEVFKVILDKDDGKRFMLGFYVRPNPKIPRTVFSTLAVPFKHNVSYADILDGILDAMEKSGSDCWMNDGLALERVGLFLKKGTTLEELSIEFDLSKREVFDFFNQARNLRI